MARWYDKYKKLQIQLDSFKEMPSKIRNRIVDAALGHIREHAPALVEEHAFDFPLDMFRRRWYDDDPSLWLLFNTLKFAEIDLIESMEGFLERKFAKHEVQVS